MGDFIPEVQVNGCEGLSFTAFISRRNFANFAAGLDMEVQSYKIYFNDGALVIADSPEALRGLSNMYFIGDDELQKSFKILLSSQNNGKPLHFGLISEMGCGICRRGRLSDMKTKWLQRCAR